jgi:HPt (histidine-containing phosphotransfer) domain-containing protein
MAASEETEYQHLPVWDKDKMLERLLQDEELLALLMTQFESQTRPEVIKLQQHIGDAEYPLIAQVAHKLKGASSAVEAKRVSALCENIETLARASYGPEQLKQHYQDLQLEYECFIEHIAE